MFDALRAEAEHVVKATVTSAAELSAGELDAITSRCASASTARST